MAKKKRCSKDVYTILECHRDARTGRTAPRCRIPRNPGVCFRIRKEKDPLSKAPFFTEVISTVTGKGIGYIGHSCELVRSSDQATHVNSDNTFVIKPLLKDCLNRPPSLKAQERKLRKDIRDAVRKLPRT